MKQMRSILAPLLMLLTGVLMTSCDDEQETAMMLWGTWEGQLATEFYQDRWGGIRLHQQRVVHRQLRIEAQHTGRRQEEALLLAVARIHMMSHETT